MLDVEYSAKSQFIDDSLFTKTLLAPGAEVRCVPKLGTILYDKYSSFRLVRRYLPIEASLPPVYARIIENPILTAEYIVHKDNDIYVDASIHVMASRGANAARVKETFAKILHESPPEPDQRYAEISALVFHNEGGGTWGHFIVQNIPRALLYLEKFPGGKIVVPRAQWYAGGSNFNRSLVQLGIPQSALIPVDQSTSYQFRELVIVDFLYDFAQQIPHPLSLKLLTKFQSDISDNNEQNFVHVDRNPKYKRSIDNIFEFKSMLSKHRVSSICVGDLPFDEQNNIWRTSKLIVGTLGSDFTNIVFGQENTRILCLSPDWFGDTFFYHLAVMKGMQWNELRCGRSTTENNNRISNNFCVEIATVDTMLESLARD